MITLKLTTLNNQVLELSIEEAEALYKELSTLMQKDTLPVPPLLQTSYPPPVTNIPLQPYPKYR